MYIVLFSTPDISSLQRSLSSMDLNQNPSNVTPQEEAHNNLPVAPIVFEVPNDISPALFASTSTPMCPEPIPSSTSASHRRTLRPRPEASDSLLHGINRRTISRPRKFSSLNPSDITEKDIINLYLNKKLPRVKPTSLETIFEASEEGSETEAATPSALESQFKLVGLKKLKRSLSFSTDHSRTNKATVLKRRRRIKDRLGTTKKPTKFSMQMFIEKMEAMQSNEARDLMPDSA